MARTSQENVNRKFEALDLAESTKKQPWWRKLFGQESGPSAEKYSVATCLLIGGVPGWYTAFIFQKVGKLAATAVGGGFFLLQLANHTGYIKVDWKWVEKGMKKKKAKEQLKIRKNNQTPTEVKSKAEEVVPFVKKSVLMTGQFFFFFFFFGGFLLGIGILRSSLHCFVVVVCLFVSCQQLLHSNIGQLTLPFLLFSCAFLPVVANLNGSHRLPWLMKKPRLRDTEDAKRHQSRNGMGVRGDGIGEKGGKSGQGSKALVKKAVIAGTWVRLTPKVYATQRTNIPMKLTGGTPLFT
ncbi:LOW QUALITY PROTEIN: FUN14 domain-containing protein 2-like [Acomys russatus]|uniref:LOW QUALITY PROTEIN: FUN14 domain-containing protein 2-like n=1 Tax=Acomys russatus TaxID=60746 RepID=UPI0021E25D70|nr:LOW QUALITY PROTEIN: FUN14 domain-containing protein 2-like [Acomys russatus]